jgi:hypothetical protein
VDGRAGLSFSRQEVLALPSPVQGAGGVYDRWFHCLPPLVDARGCHRYEELTLLHARISPRQPPRNGSPSSQQTLRQRLRTHYAGNAEGSTLRKTLGYLLAGELNIQLRRVGSGTRKTFVEGKRALSAWMATTPSSAGSAAMCPVCCWLSSAFPWLRAIRVPERLSLPLGFPSAVLAFLPTSLASARCLSADECR